MSSPLLASRTGLCLPLRSGCFGRAPTLRPTTRSCTHRTGTWHATCLLRLSSRSKSKPLEGCRGLPPMRRYVVTHNNTYLHEWYENVSLESLMIQAHSIYRRVVHTYHRFAGYAVSSALYL